MSLPSIDRDKFYEAVIQTPTAEEPAVVAQFVKFLMTTIFFT